MEEDSMNKLLIGTALLFTALPFTFDDVTPTVSKAHAVIGRPLTPMSVAGVHRRAMRRAYGVGANIGYHPVARAALYGAAATGAGYCGAGYGGWDNGYGYHPVARAALYGAAANGAGYYGAGYGGWGNGYGYGAPSYAGFGWGGGYSQEPIKSAVIDAEMQKSRLDRTFGRGPCEITGQ
jgi:hypothetical protein